MARRIIRARIKINLTVRIRNGGVNHHYVGDAIQAQMFIEIPKVPEHRFEGHNLPCRSNQLSRQQSVEPHICSHVEDDMTRLDFPREERLLLKLVAAQPTTMSARPSNPFLAPQRSLQNADPRV